jgi:hypothetical protein
VTSSEGSCESGGSGVETKHLDNQQEPSPPPPPVQPDATATTSMSNYGATYEIDNNGLNQRVNTNP